MTAEEKSGQNSSPPEPKRSVDEIAEMEARADEARQVSQADIGACISDRDDDPTLAQPDHLHTGD